MYKIRVLICDDHQIFIDGIRMGLEKEADLHLIGQALKGEEVAEKVESLKPDILLLDIELPGVNGIQLTRKLAKQFPTLGIIALTMHDNAQTIQRMIRAGAKGYLIKNTSMQEVAQAIREVHQMGQSFKGVVLNRIVEFSSGNPKGDPIDILTERELEVLRYITNGKSNAEIAELLFISIHTVNSHRKNILKKLNQKNTAELVSFALKNKLV